MVKLTDRIYLQRLEKARDPPVSASSRGINLEGSKQASHMSRSFQYYRYSAFSPQGPLYGPAIQLMARRI